MEAFVGVIIYCVIGYFVVPWAHEIETAEGPEADLRRLAERGPLTQKGGGTLLVLMILFFPGWLVAKGVVATGDALDRRRERTKKNTSVSRASRSSKGFGVVDTAGRWTLWCTTREQAEAHVAQHGGTVIERDTEASQRPWASSAQK